ncbi:hypothetical protein RINTHM_14820 [Richelia intracellularis HM01]|nr:hypothetical protein RINTHM_14820 [Richelia intracellularis HM01]
MAKTSVPFAKLLKALKWIETYKSTLLALAILHLVCRESAIDLDFCGLHSIT